jgi:RNA recognition motif-containing protein
MTPAAHYGAHFPSKAGSIPASPTSSLPLRPINDGTTVFLSGLPFYQSESELRSLLKRYGNVLYLEIHPDRRNPGKNKGTARARYKTLSEALSAVRGLDGQLLRDRKISVKQERDDASGPTGPRRPLQAGKDSPGSTASPPQQQKKNVGVPSAASDSKSKKSRVVDRGPSRASERSQGSTSSTASGPLVVNGASAQRGIQGAASSRDSDASSEEDSEDDENSEASSDEDEEEGVQEVRPTLLKILAFTSHVLPFGLRLQTQAQSSGLTNFSSASR